MQGLCDNKVIWSYSNAYESKVYRLNNDGSSKEIASVNGWLDIKCSENIIYVATDKGENACFLTCDGAIVADYSKYTLETSEKYSKYIGDYAAVVIRGADNNLYLQIIDGQGNCQFEPIKLNSTINISEGKVACILPEDTNKVVWIDYQGKVSNCPANITGKLSFNNGYAFNRSVKNYISRDGTCMELSIIKINLENQQKGTVHTIPEDSSEATHADARNSIVSVITHAPENEIVISQTTGNEMPENSGGADYIIPDSDSRYLTWDDVSGLSLREINYAKNEIYARHGRMFDSKELMEYFSTKSWYSPKYDADIFDEIYAPQLNEYEIDNAFFLRSVEFEISPEGYMLDQQS